MAKVRFVSNIPQVMRAIDKQLTRNHKKVGQILQRQMKRNVRPGGSAGFKKTHGGSGLLGSINYRVWSRGSTYTTRVGSGVKVGTAVPYGAIHERGGWIFAKSGGALAIPIHRDAKKAKSPREFTDLHLIPRAGKPPLLVRIIGAGKKDRRKKRWDLMYILKPAVFLPMRSYVRPALAQQFREVKATLMRPPRAMRKSVVAK